MTDVKDAKAIFLQAVECDGAEQLIPFLDEACGTDAVLRTRVEELMRAHRDAGAFLGADGDANATSEMLIAERIGARIGSYKLLEQIGEGGFGVVFMAEQMHPVRRYVALKIIKAGMDSRQVIGRFEAERQALALMDHPNIAKVFDAGTTDAGRLYFVMELVKGVPITKYCDEHNLAPRQRLQLFMQVCQAVQHAHQKGIIHRDLKPSNVLVAIYDGIAVPKVIDFGVAKATGQQLTDRTMFTGFGDVIGTPEYMSPEQAELNQFDIDTRSDIYSLGVLLYELLTGSTPLEHKRVKAAALLEVLRLVREEEAPRPSTRLSTAAHLPAIAAQRSLEPRKLSGFVHGELDWIVMKALEKDRSRRYQTANGLTRDIERFLDNQPVEACPPSSVYRLRKFARRNRAALTVATAISFLVLLFVAIIGFNARERAAQRFAVEVEADVVLRDATRLAGARRWPEALAFVERAQGLLSGGGGRQELRRRANDLQADLRAVIRFEEIRSLRTNVNRDQRFDAAGSDPLYAKAFLELLGVNVETLNVDQAAEQLRARGVPLEIASALDDWAFARRWAGDRAPDRLLEIAKRMDPDPWRNRVRDAWRHQDAQALTQLAASDEVERMTPASLADLGRTLADMGAAERAVAVLRKARRQHPDDFWINSELADALKLLSPVPQQEVIRCVTTAAALRPQSAGAYFSLGMELAEAKEFEEATLAYQQALRLKPDYAIALFNLGWVLYNHKLDYDGALRCFHNVIRLDPEMPLPYQSIRHLVAEHKGPDAALSALDDLIRSDPKNGTARSERADILLERGSTSAGVAAHREAAALVPKSALAHWRLGCACARIGRWDEATVALRRSLELDPSEHERWYIAVAVYARGNHMQDYRAACRQMIDRFADRMVQPQMAERTSKACSLAPGAVDDFLAVEHLAEHAVTGTENDGLRMWFEVAKGLTVLRAGHYQEARDWLSRIPPSPNGYYQDAAKFAGLAIACHRLHQNEEARTALLNARTILGTRIDVSEASPLPADWLGWVHAQILCREADQVLQEEDRSSRPGTIRQN